MPLKDVVVVGNNWDGTVDVFDPHPPDFKLIKRINVVPDSTDRRTEIKSFSLLHRWKLKQIRKRLGEGHDQLVDDMFTSHDGRVLYVSRPSFGDVVAVDVNTEKVVWRTRMEGIRADHAAISEDSRTLLVSDSTKRKVHAIDTAEGDIVKYFESGDSPHENQYSKDGTRIYHASVGGSTDRQMCTLVYRNYPGTPQEVAATITHAKNYFTERDNSAQPWNPKRHAPDEWLANKAGNPRRQRWIDSWRKFSEMTEGENGFKTVAIDGKLKVVPA